MLLDIHFCKKELLFPISLSLLIVTLTILPIIYGYLRSNEDYKFIGLLSDPTDANTYLAWMKQAQEGNILFEEKFSTEKQPKNIFILYFLSGGFISRILKIPLPIVYQIMRMISAFTLLMVVYLFIAFFLETKLGRRITFLLICSSAGFGGYFASLYHFFGFKLPPRWIPLDQNMPELVTFWIITGYGHLSLALSFMLIIFLFMLFSIEKNKKIFSIFAGFLCFILALFHPYDIITIFIVLGFYFLFLLITKKYPLKTLILNYVLMLLISSPAVAYLYYILLTNPVIKGWSKIAYPPFSCPIGYIFAFGFIFFMAILGIFEIIKKRKDRFYFLIFWIVVISIFIYYPFLFIQRHASTGIHIPFCILAIVGFLRLCEQFNWFDGKVLKRKGIFLFSIFLLLTTPTNLMHLVVDFRNAHIRKFPYFLDKELVEAFIWLDKNISSDSIVLASRKVSNFIPAYTGSKVYIGHYAETIEHHKKEKIFEKFMQVDTQDSFRIEFLDKNGIKYFFFSDFEKSIGGFNPDTVFYLSEIYKNDKIKIYKVNR